jgi:crotonobetainyl-CoA:carnitine CoA-transferase CaiB-like acyl-CoA transferase
MNMNDKYNRVSNSVGALQGLKILDFTTLLPGPFATMNLADLGADVLRVTTSMRSDLVEQMSPFVENSTISTTGAMLGRNKKILTLDLKKDAAIEIVHQLITSGGYDIIIEQFRPGVMDRLGLGYEKLSVINPKLIYCSLSGYGQTGAFSSKAGHDINYLSLAGLMDYSGRKETGPVLTGVQIADIIGGTNNAMISILAAVISRMNTGSGQHLDVSMFDGSFALNVMFGSGAAAYGICPERESTLLNGGSAYDFYETKDGGYVSFGGLEPKFWAAFCAKLGHEEWIELTVEAGDVVKQEIHKIFLTKTRGEWMEFFADTDACIEPVLSVAEAMGSELARDRGLVVDVPVLGGVDTSESVQEHAQAQQEMTIKQIASPFKFSKTPAIYKHAGKPVTAPDNYEILSALGYDAERILQLEKDGVLR